MNNPTSKSRGRPKGTTGKYFIEVKLSDLIGQLEPEAKVEVRAGWLKELQTPVQPSETTPIPIRIQP